VGDLRRLSSADVPRLRAFWNAHWGGDFVVAHDMVFQPENVEGFVLEDSGRWVGLVTFATDQDQCEVISLDSLNEGTGNGSLLLEAVVEQAGLRGLRRIIVTTTNDNLRALRFYQKRGFMLRAIRPGALARTRELKPLLGMIGENGIPARDEIELERCVGEPFPPGRNQACT
jgi:GNAT superfamily N-acetyltransferase